MSNPTTGRRLASLLVVLCLIGAPALVLRMFCVGSSCDDEAASAAPVPFCPLPSDLRRLIVAGFRAGRSPDVMATSGDTASGDTAVVSGAPGLLVGWPWMGASPSGAVPLAFSGPGVPAGSLPPDVGLEDVAPTLAALVGFVPPHPEVRGGRPIPGLRSPASGAAPLAVEIVWKGVGARELGGRWPPATQALIGDGASSLGATVGSLPADPAAILTTIGTGGLPSQHGITGTVLRADQGGVADAWAQDAPESVIATLPDELDHAFDGRAQVGLVATDATDRGLIGDGWYLGSDRDRMIVSAADPVHAVERLMDDGYGADGAPDILGIVLRGPLRTLDGRTAAIIGAVRHEVPRAVVVVTATGTPSAGGDPVGAGGVARAVDRSMGADVIEADAAGGFFLDAEALAETGRSADAVVQALAREIGPDGAPLFSDVYPGFSVAFDRYC